MLRNRVFGPQCPLDTTGENGCYLSLLALAIELLNFDPVLGFSCAFENTLLSAANTVANLGAFLAIGAWNIFRSYSASSGFSELHPNFEPNPSSTHMFIWRCT